MSTISVHYFASLKEATGLSQEEISFEGTYKELYLNLLHKYHFNLPPEMMMVAVDDEFTTMDEVVKPQGKVVFIPPVAGG
jgi:molybdopterin synthase sulfur carrier subunit